MKSLLEQRLKELSPYLRNYAGVLTRHTEEAADLYQETVLRIIENENKFVPDTNFKAWARTIMRNLFINERHRKRLFAVPRVPETVYEIPDNTPRPDENLDLPVILQAFRHIGREQLNICKLVYQGNKYEEVAQMLNIPIWRVRNDMHNSRKLLRKLLKELER